MMNQALSETLASQVIDRLRKAHDGEKYRCVQCYRDEPCPERELVRQWDHLRSVADVAGVPPEFTPPGVEIDVEQMRDERLRRAASHPLPSARAWAASHGYVETTEQRCVREGHPIPDGWSTCACERRLRLEADGQGDLPGEPDGNDTDGGRSAE